MKKVYTAPKLEVEYYSLDMSIANNCGQVVNAGPGDETHVMCSDFEDIFSRRARSVEYNIDFYDNNSCDCYTTGTATYWTS